MVDMHMGSRTAASPGVRVEARSGAKQALARARDEQGQALVEFALILSLLLALLLGIIVLGVAFNNYLTLTNAVNMGAQALSISRGETTDPCMTTSQAVYAAAPNFTQANLQFTIVLWTSSTTSTTVGPVANPTCSGDQTLLTAGQQAAVTVTYPCKIKFFGFNPAPNCTLTAQTSEAVQ